MSTTNPKSVALLHDFEAAEYLGVLPARLKRWAKSGKVPHIVLPDGEIRFTVNDLDKWIIDNRQGAVAQGASR